MKYKILFVTSTLERSGVTNVIFNIIKYLDRNIFIPVILTLSPEPKNSRMADFLSLQTEINSLGKSRMVWILSPHNALKKIIGRIDPQVIHSHSFRADASMSKFVNNYPVVSTIHSNLFDNYKDLYGRLIGKIFEKKQKQALSKMISTIACSRSVWNEYTNSLSNLHFIQNGIDTDFFHPIQNKNTVREQLGLTIDSKLFVSIGSLTKRKDPETVISGFLKSKEAANGSLIIVGAGVLEERLKKKYGDLNNIIFTGHRGNVISYFQAADYFISASLSEGLPNSVLEALGCGLPVFLSDIPSHREILKLNKKAGILFDPNSSESLSKCLNSLAHQKDDISNEATQEIIKNSLNARYMTDQYQEVYLNVLKKGL